MTEVKMDIGIIKQGNEIQDLIIKSNIVKELPIYNNLIRALTLNAINNVNGVNELKNKLIRG